jgi:hypothetical protein
MAEPAAQIEPQCKHSENLVGAWWKPGGTEAEGWQKIWWKAGGALVEVWFAV